ERMDAVFATPLGRNLELREKPSFYFQRQCWISCDPDERSLSAIIPLVGERRFFWASDFPHPDHAPEYVKELTELVELLPAPGLRVAAGVRREPAGRRPGRPGGAGREDGHAPSRRRGGRDRRPAARPAGVLARRRPGHRRDGRRAAPRRGRHRGGPRAAPPP